MPPRSWRRDARPPRFHSGGLLSRRALSRATTQTGGALSAPQRRLSPLAWCDVITAHARCAQLSVRARPLWEGSPSRGSHGVATCGASFVILAPAWPCRRTHSGVKLGRRGSAAAALALRVEQRGRQRARAGASSLGAIAVARRSRRRYLQCRANTPGAGTLAWRSLPLRARCHSAPAAARRSLRSARSALGARCAHSALAALARRSLRSLGACYARSALAALARR